MSFRTAFIAPALSLALGGFIPTGPVEAAPSPAPSATASAAATVDPAVTARAKAWLHRAQTGNIDRTQLDDKMNQLLTDDLIKQVAAEIGPLGPPVKFEYVETRSLAPNTLYVYQATFKSQTFYWLFSTGDGGKIAGMQLTPPAQASP